MERTVTVNGVERHLGLLPTPLETIARMSDSGLLVLPHRLKAKPKADFEDVSCAHFWKYRKDQSSTSMCTGFSAAHVTSTAYAKAGFDIDISPAAIYAPICGGRDGGASMGDALEALQKYGAFRSGYKGIGDHDWRTAYRTKFWQSSTSEVAIEAGKLRILESAFLGADVDPWLAHLDSGEWSGPVGMGAGNNFEPDDNGSLPAWNGTGINHALFATGGMRHHPKKGHREVEGGNSWRNWGSLNGLFYFDPYDWLRHRGQELWLVRALTIPLEV